MVSVIRESKDNCLCIVAPLRTHKHVARSRSDIWEPRGLFPRHMEAVPEGIVRPGWLSATGPWLGGTPPYSVIDMLCKQIAIVSAS